jgi:hypothetical protein
MDSMFIEQLFGDELCLSRDGVDGLDVNFLRSSTSNLIASPHTQ